MGQGLSSLQLAWVHRPQALNTQVNLAASTLQSSIRVTLSSLVRRLLHAYLGACPMILYAEML